MSNNISYHTIIKNKRLDEFDVAEIVKPISEHDKKMQILDKLGVEKDGESEDEVL